LTLIGCGNAPRRNSPVSDENNNRHGIDLEASNGVRAVDAKEVASYLLAVAEYDTGDQFACMNYRFRDLPSLLKYLQTLDDDQLKCGILLYSGKVWREPDSVKAIKDFCIRRNLCLVVERAMSRMATQPTARLLVLADDHCEATFEEQPKP
jgi:hypothetical protein